MAGYNNRVGPQGEATEPMTVPGSARDYDKGKDLSSASEAPMTKHGVEEGTLWVDDSPSGMANVHVDGPGGSAQGFSVDESRWGPGQSSRSPSGGNTETEGYVENKTVRAGNQNKQYGKGETRGG